MFGVLGKSAKCVEFHRSPCVYTNANVVYFSEQMTLLKTSTSSNTCNVTTGDYPEASPFTPWWLWARLLLRTLWPFLVTVPVQSGNTTTLIPSSKPAQATWLSFHVPTPNEGVRWHLALVDGLCRNCCGVFVVRLMYAGGHTQERYRRSFQSTKRRPETALDAKTPDLHPSSWGGRRTYTLRRSFSARGNLWKFPRTLQLRFKHCKKKRGGLALSLLRVFS